MLVETSSVMKQGFSPMQWLLAQAEDAPRLTPEQWAEWQRSLYEQQVQQLNDSLWGPLWIYWVIEALGVLFTLWMIIYCIRNDSERGTWLWVLIVFPGIGPVIYFFARWLPSSSMEPPAFLRRWTEGAQIQRLEVAAQQIGNAHQFVEWGDALRDVKQWPEARAAYLKALAKEPTNLPALWGVANTESQLGEPQAARPHLAAILGIDPAYKFGDVSLLYGKTLHLLQDREAELAHWRTHLKRWRQPEALYLLAKLFIERGEYPEARQLLQTLIADIELTPRALARKVFFWKGRAKKLLRCRPLSSLPVTHTLR